MYTESHLIIDTLTSLLSFMKPSSRVLLFLLLTLSIVPAVAGQKKTKPTVEPPQLVRTIMRSEQRRFGHGGTLTIVGAPEGSISIEAWPRNEVSINADIQLRAHTEQDLDRLATVSGFMLDEDANHIRILSAGTHDKAYMRRVAKNFPKTLLGLPWKIDYRIRVPANIDIEINAGRGPIRLSGVEGAIQLSAAESETDLRLAGGALAATVAKGKVTLQVSEKTWRRGGADIRVAMGEVNLEMPAASNADIDAEILRSGQIVDSYGGLEPRDDKDKITAQKMKARTGAGGAFFQLTVGDGVINIRKATPVVSSQ